MGWRYTPFHFSRTLPLRVPLELDNLPSLNEGSHEITCTVPLIQGIIKPLCEVDNTLLTEYQGSQFYVLDSLKGLQALFEGPSIQR